MICWYVGFGHSKCRWSEPSLSIMLGGGILWGSSAECSPRFAWSSPVILSLAIKWCMFVCVRFKNNEMKGYETWIYSRCWYFIDGKQWSGHEWKPILHHARTNTVAGRQAHDIWPRFERHAGSQPDGHGGGRWIWPTRRWCQNSPSYRTKRSTLNCFNCFSILCRLFPVFYVIMMNSRFSIELKNIVKICMLEFFHQIHQSSICDTVSHRVYDYLGPFGVLWVRMSWYNNCVS